MLIVVMGVSGSGKTTVGRLLAASLDCEFLDGDWLHTQTHIDAIRRGVPLTEADRAPWLAAIHARLRDAFDRGASLVVACSALNVSYRIVLARELPIEWIYLKGDAALIRARLRNRHGHFAGAGLLDSQLATLEEPRDAIVEDIARPPAAIVADVIAALQRR
jgi:gluconokinase